MHIVEVNRKYCKKCGVCISFCPKKVLERNEDGGPIVARIEDCIGCKMCEMHCPDFAIVERSADNE